MMYAYALGGFVMLFGGGEWLVRGALTIARRFGASPLLIGMTIVAACTSAPELVVSVQAALEGQSDMAMGNVVGSNIFNILGVLGAAALIAPIVIAPARLKRDTATMVGAALVLAIMSQFGQLSRPMGLLLFAGIVAFVWISYRSERRNPHLPSAELHEEESNEISSPTSLWAGIGLLGAGLVSLVVGSTFLISGATDIARFLGISEGIIGLTLVAVGTSLPELATSVIAAVRRHSEVAVGNVVGSNIFNILGILGISSMISPLTVNEQMAGVGVWSMLLVSVLMVPFLLIRGRIGRVAGAGFLAVYVIYAAYLFGVLPI